MNHGDRLIERQGISADCHTAQHVLQWKTVGKYKETNKRWDLHQSGKVK